MYEHIGRTGHHVAYLLVDEPEAVVRYLKIQTSAEFVYLAGVTAPKVCILLLYLRIFGVQNAVRIGSWISMAIVLANWVSTGVIAWGTICKPLAFKWDKTIPGGSCADLMASYKYVSIPNILTDLSILLLPLPTLYKLQMSRVRKVGLLVTFVMGSL